MAGGTVKDKQKIKITGDNPGTATISINGKKILATSLELQMFPGEFPIVRIGVLPEGLNVVLKQCEIILKEDHKPIRKYGKTPIEIAKEQIEKSGYFWGVRRKKGIAR